MSDRGRNRRPARSTKATPPKAAPAEPDATTTEEQDAPPAEVSTEPAAETTEVAATEEPATEAPAADETEAEAVAEPDETAEVDETAEADETTATDAEEAAEAESSDETAKSDDTEPAEKPEKADKPKAKTKAPAPLTKAEKRAAARVAARKAARRRRTGQAIAGTIIVLLAVGGAFAGVWYFGDRAEKQKTMCKKSDESSYPPMLGGFDKRLADEPKAEAGKEAKVGSLTKDVVIQGNCKTVKAGDTVVVNYVGLTYKDGKVFDSSWQRKQTFPVQVGMLEQSQQPQVIEGWDRGLVGLKVGSRVILDVPAKQAYGDPAPQGYPNGDLRFYVDILDIQAADAGGGLTVPGN
ncbi:FKBP-type peptidyl-prolyl cis-trans isomerase [Dactylosporangium sp. CA-092794]|uniref:FKBP-type peptidyl-prolyl cis-trans isomerase n=1 Tax=Dactylosporangium sp. CA-092794 TaxID=3239929 RepID=UPI003D919C37